MRTETRRKWWYEVTTALLMFALVYSWAAVAQAETATAKKGWYHDIVEFDFIGQHAVIPPKSDAVIIDSRPTKRKYDKSHIPGAISIPDSQFDQLAGNLPEAKDTLLIFYCGGVKCMLSHNSAFKAEKLGYTNIKVYAAGYPDWKGHDKLQAVSPAYVKKLVETGKDVVIVDSRPKKRKYDKGHIPGAISIPDSQFDQLAGTLPEAKDALIVFYCGGYKCALSSNSAVKAKALGYTKVKTLPAGFPAWKKIGGAVDKAGQATAKKVRIAAGAEEGTITVESFEKILKENPDSVHIIDVRDSDEFATGALATAKNIHINDLVKDTDMLPTDKPVIFVCGTGARSGEAYDITVMMRDDIKAYFVDAEMEFNKDGSYTIKAHEG